MNGDIYFNAGSRLRISTHPDDGYIIWVRWGWRAERQWAIHTYCKFLWFRGEFLRRYEVGPFSYTRFL